MGSGSGSGSGLGSGFGCGFGSGFGLGSSSFLRSMTLASCGGSSSSSDLSFSGRSINGTTTPTNNINASRTPRIIHKRRPSSPSVHGNSGVR
ncbi:MAG TPA: hypothetical protein DE015_05180 [Oceanospirillales bacterium]|nr:hypothetical protein [Oceanospirillales bacterium]